MTFEGLEDAGVVLHCLQVSGAQKKFLLLVALGVILGVILGIILDVIDGVVLEILRRIVLDVVTLCSSAAHVGCAHTSSSGDPTTAVFAIISDLRNPVKTTARTNCFHDLSDTPQTVVTVECLSRSVQLLIIHYDARARILFNLCFVNLCFAKKTILRSQTITSVRMHATLQGWDPIAPKCVHY